jgi:FMN phosphatase YigB (HAD superfamily)
MSAFFPSRAILAAIFDLDDTLYDCFGQRVIAAHRYAAEAMVRAGLRATPEEVFQARLAACQENPQLEWVDAAVCKQFGVSDIRAVAGAARTAFLTMPVGKLTLSPGALPTLRYLAGRGVRVFLVTFGDPVIQRAKVAALALEKEAAIERIYYAAATEMTAKRKVFAAILHSTGAEPDEVLVVGDRPDGEIQAGKLLGMRPVRVRGGEFASVVPKTPEEQSDFEITSLDALMALPLRFGPEQPENR